MDRPVWKVELHAHTIYSKDSLVRLESIQQICRDKGIERLAITDHNRARAALDLAHSFPMLIIPGEEIMTTRGELLAWYIREEIPAGLSPFETIHRLRDQGAVIGIAHPFDRYRHGAWELKDLDSIIDHVDAIEVLNARCLNADDNAKAKAYAEKHGKLMVAGSDAHTPREYGRGLNLLPPFSNNADGFRQALASATFEFRKSGLGVHFSSSYAKYIKKVIRSLHPA